MRWQCNSFLNFMILSRCDCSSPQLHRFMQGGLSLFMAVPTIYSRLIQEIDKLPKEVGRANISCSNLISGAWRRGKGER